MSAGLIAEEPWPRRPNVTLDPGRDLWVFGYGSLMWNPGFPHLEHRPALLHGYHRKFCIYSYRYRGTPERPGLVLGLDRGGSCRGIVFRVSPGDAPAVLEYLWEREMITGVYRPTQVVVSAGGEKLRACTFVAQRRHRQYCGGLESARVAECIRGGCGDRGPNLDYLANTVLHLRELGIHDESLERLYADVVSGTPRGAAAAAFGQGRKSAGGA